MSKKKKTYTVYGHRKIQAIKNQARLARSEGYKEAYKEACRKIVNLIPISQQVIDTVDAGLDVTIECNISAKEFLKILRNE